MSLICYILDHRRQTKNKDGEDGGNDSNDDDDDDDNEDDDDDDDDGDGDGDDPIGCDDEIIESHVSQAIDRYFEEWKTNLEQIMNSKTSVEFPYPKELTKQIITNIDYASRQSEAVLAIREVVQYLIGNPRFDIFCKYVWGCLSEFLISATQNPRVFDTTTLTKFQELSLKFWLSQNFRNAEIVLYEHAELSFAENLVAADAFHNVKEYFVGSVPNENNTEVCNLATDVAEVNKFGEARVRYLAGRAIFKQYRKAQKSAYTKSRNMEESDSLLNQMQLLSDMRITEMEAEDTTSKIDSLSYVKSRQRPGCELTYVSDNTLDFFKAIEEKRRQCTTLLNVAREKENILEYTKMECLKDDNLRSKFETTIPHRSNDQKDTLFESLVLSYLRPPQNDCRKHLATMLGKKRALKHRVQILTENEKQLKKDNTESVTCGACGGLEISTPGTIEWFLCDDETCGRWFHAGCVGLTTHEQIGRAKVMDPWFCPQHTSK